MDSMTGMLAMTRRRALIAGVVAVVSALVVLGAYLVWPAPTLDAADLDAALPTERDLPGFIPHNGLIGALSTPSDNDEGRSVLAGAALEEQCRIWREEGDAWACRRVHGAGIVVLEQSENVFFRVLSVVLAYDDEEAAQVAWDGLVDDQVREIGEVPNRPDGEVRSAGLGDESVMIEFPDVTMLAIRTETVVVEAGVWDGSGQVDEPEERDMVERWPALQLAKIEEQLD
ncbi:hypothetical protein [Nocardiopsis trehalosi]|jgi:hypothetical protein|uniref:hypothetical protein n=1 Tax=Nocardiopsis trehalosi TaxID=109329 RepID=UPI000834B502|nr:hypothetical protein [Nocardiopsis trehalosi]